MIVDKIGKRPSAREVGVGYAHAWWFRIGDVKLLAALDDRQRLLWLRLKPLDRETADAIARRAAARIAKPR